MKLFKKFMEKREVFIAREMTKIHETFYRQDLESFNGFKEGVKGEITVVLSKIGEKV